MNSTPLSPDQHAWVPTVTRREALKRAAVFLGAALSPSILSGVLQAQSATPAAGTRPVYLSAAQAATAAAIAERILPRTDTPGAMDAGVPAFIDLMYGKFMSAEEKKVFVAGLTEIDALATSVGGKPFAPLPPEQQDEVLRRLAAASARKDGTFLHLIREQTIVGYFTSELVGKTVLHYDPVPGRFDSCVPIAEVGNVQWTK